MLAFNTLPRVAGPAAAEGAEEPGAKPVPTPSWGCQEGKQQVRKQARGDKILTFLKQSKSNTNVPETLRNHKVSC